MKILLLLVVSIVFNCSTVKMEGIKQPAVIKRDTTYIPFNPTTAYYGIKKSKRAYKTNSTPEKRALHLENIREVIPMINGKKDGLSKVYTKSGLLLHSVEYKDGLRDGATRFYFDNGDIESESIFKNNIFLYRSKSFNLQGQQINKLEVKGDIIFNTFYNPDGSHKKIIEQVIGKYKVVKEFSTFGILQKEKKYLSKDKIESESSFFENGNKKTDDFYKGRDYYEYKYDIKGFVVEYTHNEHVDDETKVTKIYNRNNVLIKSIPLKFTGKYYSKDGIVKEYYNTGQIKYSCFFKKGKKEGIEKTFYENGNIRSERTYRNVIKHRREVTHSVEKIFYENGNIKSKINYRDGLKRGLHIEYRLDGSISNRENITPPQKKRYDRSIMRIEEESHKKKIMEMERILKELENEE